MPITLINKFRELENSIKFVIDMYTMVGQETFDGKEKLEYVTKELAALRELLEIQSRLVERKNIVRLKDKAINNKPTNKPNIDTDKDIGIDRFGFGEIEVSADSFGFGDMFI